MSNILKKLCRSRLALRQAGRVARFFVALSAFILCFGQASLVNALSCSSQPSKQIKKASLHETYGDFEVIGEGGSVSSLDSRYITIDGGSYSISMAAGVASTSQRIVITGGATLTLNGIQIDATTDGPAIYIDSDSNQDVTILLADGSNNTLKGRAGDYTENGAPGILKNTSTGRLIIDVPENAEGTGILKAEGGFNAAAIGGYANVPGSNIEIVGGNITAQGGFGSAGIGGSFNSAGNNIQIKGGNIEAIGGNGGPGIGGGMKSNGSTITISGGTVKAIGGNDGAGIGGGASSTVQSVTITGGMVTATGNRDAYGIGWGDTGSATNITINGHTAVVKAKGGQTDTYNKPALPDNASLQQGIVYTSEGDSGVWSGTLYGDAELNQDLSIPANLTVPAGQVLSIASGKRVTLSEVTGAKYTIEGELQNEGTLILPSDIVFMNNGKLTTLLAYDAQGGSFDNLSDSYQLYQDASGTGKKYKNLPQPTNNAAFGGWYSETGGQGKKIDSAANVELNLHKVFADMAYTVSFDTQGGSAIDSLTNIVYDAKITKPTNDPTRAGYTFDGWYKEAACTNAWDFTTNTIQADTTIYAGWKADIHNISTSAKGQGSIQIASSTAEVGSNVDITLVPDEGYKYDEGSLSVLAGTTPVSVTEKGDFSYSFEMPASDVVISASFIADDPTPPGPEPTPTPPGPEPTPTPTPQPEPATETDGGNILPLTGDINNVPLLPMVIMGAGIALTLLCIRRLV